MLIEPMRTLRIMHYAGGWLVGGTIRRFRVRFRGSRSRSTGSSTCINLRNSSRQWKRPLNSPGSCRRGNGENMNWHSPALRATPLRRAGSKAAC
jgi:hypothetical protein